eukprot:scaffold77762_cov49-Attheya_sp.AAC.4
MSSILNNKNFVRKNWLDGCSEFANDDDLLKSCAGNNGNFIVSFATFLFFVLTAIAAAFKPTSNREAWPAKYIMYLFLVSRRYCRHSEWTLVLRSRSLDMRNMKTRHTFVKTVRQTQHHDVITELRPQKMGSPLWVSLQFCSASDERSGMIGDTYIAYGTRYGTLVFISLSSGLLATFSCHMIEFKDINNPNNNYVGLGLFGREDLIDEDTYDCISYTENEKDDLFDANWRSARAMGILMVIFATILTIVMFVIICCGISKKGSIVLGVFSLLTSLLAFLELLVLNSALCDLNDCNLGYSGGVAIVTGVLFFFATIPICMFRDVKRKPRAKKEKKEEKKEKEADDEEEEA